MNRKEKIMKRMQEHLEELEKRNYKVIGIFLQGSQNYDLDYEGSDIDTKAIVLPTFEQIVFNTKPVSTTLILENDEHIDVKDIRIMFSCFKKQNINFLEILFTDYFILNKDYAELLEPIFEFSEEIAKYDNYAAVNCMCGMALEKYKALEHPYPAIVYKIEKFGYDPKQLHHILRMEEFFSRRLNGTSFKSCLKPRDAGYLLDVKLGVHDLETARRLAKESVDRMGKMKDEFKDTFKQSINVLAEEVLNEVLYNVLRKSFKEEFDSEE